MSETRAGARQSEVEPMGLREAVGYRLGTLRLVARQRRKQDRIERRRARAKGDTGYDWFAPSAQGEDNLTPEVEHMARVIFAVVDRDAGRPYDEKIIAEDDERQRYNASPWSRLLSLNFPPFVIREEPIHLKLPPQSTVAAPAPVSTDNH
ncbi:MAG TPA: hypothetical protein VK712_03765 [Verrucomicrobiae bacterium]|jgi:hypothetical protein|nr:hypothetical protein [Verrucomicrobiae bacterium]